MKELGLIAIFLSLNVYASVCSQEEIEKHAKEEAELHRKYVQAKKFILGRGTYVGGAKDGTGYFPLFLFDVDCQEFGRKKCDQSAILFANLSSCSVTPGPTNPNFQE